MGGNQSAPEGPHRRVLSGSSGFQWVPTGSSCSEPFRAVSCAPLRGGLQPPPTPRKAPPAPWRRRRFS
eukprot:7168247-Alexandrium_andersonii.AAC.1